MTRRRIFKALGEEEELDHSALFSQTVDALDQAGEIYHTNNDPEGFLQVANGYLQLSKHWSDLKEAGISVSGESHEGKRKVDTNFRVGFALPEEQNG